MGAEFFIVNMRGDTARGAFDEAVRQACYDHGHSGGSGTIAEKRGRGFVVIPLPDGEVAASFANRLLDGDERIDCKWGPAGCIEIVDEAEPDPDRRTFVFFGWANS